MMCLHIPSFLMPKTPDYAFPLFRFSAFFYQIVWSFRIFLYLCQRFGEKSGLNKAFAIISRSAKSLGNLLEIKTHRDNT